MKYVCRCQIIENKRQNKHIDVWFNLLVETRSTRVTSTNLYLLACIMFPMVSPYNRIDIYHMHPHCRSNEDISRFASLQNFVFENVDQVCESIKFAMNNKIKE